MTLENLHHTVAWMFRELHKSYSYLPHTYFLDINVSHLRVDWVQSPARREIRGRYWHFYPFDARCAPPRPAHAHTLSELFLRLAQPRSASKVSAARAASAPESRSRRAPKSRKGLRLSLQFCPAGLSVGSDLTGCIVTWGGGPVVIRTLRSS